MKEGLSACYFHPQELPMDIDKQSEKQFFADYNKVSNRLRAYLRQLLPSQQDAEEVLQETSIVLWNKYGEFEQGTHFFAWAYKIAYFEALKYRRSKARDRLVFSDDVFEKLAQRAVTTSEAHDKRKAALKLCFEKLPSKSQALLKAVYFKKQSIKNVAEELNTQPKAMYRFFTKVRHELKHCIEGHWHEGS